MSASTDLPTVAPASRRPTGTIALLMVGITAVSFAAVLIRLADAPAVALSFWRSLGGALVLAPFAAWGAGRPTGAQRRDLLIGGVCLAAHFALFIGAFSYTSVAAAVVFVTTSPLFVGLGSWIFLGQPPTRRSWTGIALACVGAIVIGVADADGGSAGSNPLLGDLMALGGAIAVSGYLIVGQRARATMDVATYGTWVYGSAAVVLVALAAVLRAPLVGFDATTWWAIGGLLVGPQLLGHTIFNQTLNRVSATTVAVVTLAEPIGASLLALLILGEVPGRWLLAGAPLILLGVYLAASSPRRRPASRHADGLTAAPAGSDQPVEQAVVVEEVPHVGGEG